MVRKIDTFNSLHDEWNEWCKAHHYHHFPCALEMLMFDDTLTAAQRIYVEEFTERWESLEGQW